MRQRQMQQLPVSALGCPDLWSDGDSGHAQEVFLTPRYLAIVTEYANGGDLAQYMSQLPQVHDSFGPIPTNEGSLPDMH